MNVSRLNRKTGIMALVSVVALLLVAFAPIVMDESDAASADKTDSFYLTTGSNGGSATYTISFTNPLPNDRLTVTIAASTSNPGATTAITDSGSAYGSSKSANDITGTVTSKNANGAVITFSATKAVSKTAYFTIKIYVSGSEQTIYRNVAVTATNPSLSYATINTYAGGTVAAVSPTVSGTTGATSTSYSFVDSTAAGGLTIDSKTGKISGTATTTAGTYTPTVKMALTYTGGTVNVTKQVSIVVASSMSINSNQTFYDKAGTAGSHTVAGTATTGATTWAYASDATTVTGITVSGTGTSGTIIVANTVAAGTYSIKVAATNPVSGQTVSNIVTVKVGSTSITKVTNDSTNKQCAVSSNAVTIYGIANTAATYTVTNTVTPSDLTDTLTVSGTDASKVTVNGQKFSVTAQPAGTYTLVLTETQASTGATYAVTVTLIVDNVPAITSATVGGLTLA